MSEFHLITLGIAVGIVIAVWGFNIWQEHRFKKRAAAAFARNHPDVLLDTPKNMVRPGENSRRVEPSIESIAPESATVMGESLHIAGEAVQMDDPLALAEATLDPAFDYIADVHFGEPVKSAVIPPFDIGRRVRVLGLAASDEWEVVRPAGIYSELRIGIQLVDRQGPINEGHLAVFCERINDFAEQNHGVATFPRREDKLRVARELDQFCAEVDAVIGLNVVASRNPFQISRISALATGAGMGLEPDGAFHAYTDSGKTLFTLIDRHHRPIDALDDTPSVTLLLDLPRVAGGQQAFDRMADLAQQLALNLGGDLVDDDNRSLKPADLANIRAQLGAVSARMDDRGIPAGGVVALRLFS